MRTIVPGTPRPSVLFLIAVALLAACLEFPTGPSSPSAGSAGISSHAGDGAYCDLDYAVALDGGASLIDLDPAPLGQPASVTAEAWVKLQESERTQIILSNAHDDFNDGFTLLVSHGRPSFSVAKSTSTKGSATGVSALEVDRWYHLAGVYDAEQGRVSVWVDGEEAASASYSAGITYHSGRDLLLGAQVKSFNRSSRYLAGTLDDARIWSLARTGEQLSAGMNAEAAPDADRLTGYWKMDEGTGEVTHDEISEENMGRLTDGAEWSEGYCDGPVLQQLDIDVKPGDEGPSSIHPNHGKIPVAVLGAPDLDVSGVYPASLTFGRTGDEPSLNLLPGARPHCGVEDVNGDGHDDLVCHFRSSVAGFESGDTEAVLRGMMQGEIPVEGRDEIRMK